MRIPPCFNVSSKAFIFLISFSREKVEKAIQEEDGCDCVLGPKTKI